MDTTIQILIALGILALLIIAFFAVFRGKGKFSISTKLGSASAEGENPAPPTTVASGVNFKGVNAGRNVTAHSSAEGGVSIENAKAHSGSVTGIHTPGAPPPKT